MSERLLNAVAPLLGEIRRRADFLDQTGDWPGADLQALARAGILSMALPAGYAGGAASALDQHLLYETLASASLPLSLILSQRDAAIGLIEGSDFSQRKSLLDQLAEGAFATVGVAQLTTSRQGGPPAVRAHRVPGGYCVTGAVPWSTGAAKARFILVGAAADDGQNLLFSVSASAPGLTIDPPLSLVALRSTWTTAMRCENVHIPDAAVLRCAAGNVLGRANHLPIGQAFLATGLCRGGLDLIHAHPSPSAQSAAQRFEDQLVELRDQLLQLSQSHDDSPADPVAVAARIRGRCNDLALRIAHTAVALYKGAALVTGHPAQRLAREALFLLVWSCPTPVIDCTVEILSNE